MIPISFLLCSLEKEEDRDKLSAIYEKYLPLMSFVACRYVGRYNAEEDVVHDAIITIINNLDDLDLDNEEKTRRYVYKTVRSRSIDWLRHERHSLIVEDIDDPSIYIEDDIMSPVDQIILKDGYNYLVQCIRSLKDSYRLVCEMRLIDNMDYEQIAEKLGITKDNASVRYTRGICKLKIMMRNGGYYDERVGK